MGHRYAPSYADLYISEWEREALEKCPLKPCFYLRFLDDIVGAWPYSLSAFEDFIDILNNHPPCIKVKHCIDPVKIDFLDTTISLVSVNTTQKKMTSKDPAVSPNLYI